MTKRIPSEELEAIEEAVRRHPGGVTARQIAPTLPPALLLRTLQYRLKYLVDAGRLARKGGGRRTTYHLSVPRGGVVPAGTPKEREEGTAIVPLSKAGAEIRAYLRQPSAARKPAGYRREFLDTYRPGVTAYLTAKARAHLAEMGRPDFATAASRNLRPPYPESPPYRSVLELEPLGGQHLFPTRYPPSHRIRRRSRRS